MAAGRFRAISAAVCGALGVLLIVVAVLLGYLTRTFFNERSFASRVSASLEDPRFAEFVAEQIADAVIKTKPDLVGVRPVLVGVARNVVSSPPFRAAVRRGARAAHRALLSGAGREIVLDVKDLGLVLESMAETHPGLAKKIPSGVTAAVARVGSFQGALGPLTLARLAARLRAGTLAFLVLGIALCAVAVWRSAQRRRAIMRIGVALATLGLLLAIHARYGASAIGLVAHREQYEPALAGLASAFLNGLLAWAAALGFAGLVLAAASASLLERVPLAHWQKATVGWLAGPQPLMRYRFVRGLLGALAGAALLFWPLASLTILAWLCGLLVVFVGLREAFVAALHLFPQIDFAPSPGTQGRGVGRGAVAMVGGIAVVLLGVAAWLVLRPSAMASEPVDFTACNGLPELCERRFDQVVFPTSHNSMSGADVPQMMFPNQDAGIQKQLADGVRGFMIDAHYGIPVGDRVKTAIDEEGSAMAKYEAAVGKEGMDAALRIRDRLGKEEAGPRDVYMCHGFCELGAVPLTPVLKDVRDFLVANPGEVLIFVIQDEGVSPQDIERCFRESGLIEFVYRGPARPPWPTLRQMVESDQRVLVMAENQSAGVDWYHPAFEVMQETPYTFGDPSEFSNLPNRGGTTGSLMLLNHWIQTTPMPKPSNAAIVNAHDALLERIEDFRRRRGRLPNLVAVDFYATGDMIRVVRELNERPLSQRASR